MAMLDLIQSKQPPVFSPEAGLGSGCSRSQEAAGAALCGAVISLCHTREHSCLSNASEPSLRLPPFFHPQAGNLESRFPTTAAFRSALATAGQETPHKSSRFCSYQTPPSKNHCQPNSLPISRQPLALVFAGSSLSWAGFLPHLDLLLPCF